MVNLSYLSGIIPVMFGEYFFVLGIIAWLFVRSPQNSNLSLTDLMSKYFSGKPLSTVGVSMWGKYNKRWNIVLLLTRLSSFLFFLGPVCIFGYIRQSGKNWYYFTVWNIDLVFVYYLFATICSFICIFAPDKGNSDDILKFGYATQILFELAGANALFITIVDFLLLSSEFYYWNVAQHFMTSISFLGEMALNDIPVRWEHVAINLTWPLIYLVVIWPVVSTGALTHWPYDFLSVGGGSCFVWYSVLFLVNILFFFLWYGLHLLKMRYAGPSESQVGVATGMTAIEIPAVGYAEDSAVGDEGADSPLRPSNDV